MKSTILSLSTADIHYASVFFSSQYQNQALRNVACQNSKALTLEIELKLGVLFSNMVWLATCYETLRALLINLVKAIL